MSEAGGGRRRDPRPRSAATGRQRSQGNGGVGNTHGTGSRGADSTHGTGSRGAGNTQGTSSSRTGNTRGNGSTRGSGQSRGGGPKAGPSHRPDPREPRDDPQSRDDRPQSRGDRRPSRGDQRPSRAGQSRRPEAAERRSGSEVGQRRERPALKPPPDADVRLLDEDIRADLRSLSPENADLVGRHLVAVGQLLDDDPEQALAHARAARKTAGRVAAVREAVGLAAYRAGEWQEALSELRAARRMTGDNGQLPIMADCERGLGRPERALAMARQAEVGQLEPASRIEMRIVEAGARRDLGDVQAALVVLQDAGVHSDSIHEWTPRLWYAYADTLAAAGRLAEAEEWFRRVSTIDESQQTDADERLAELPLDQ